MNGLEFPSRRIQRAKGKLEDNAPRESDNTGWLSGFLTPRNRGSHATCTSIQNNFSPKQRFVIRVTATINWSRAVVNIMCPRCVGSSFHSNMMISLLFTLGLLESVTCTFYTHSKSLNQQNDTLNIGLILPHTNFGVREYIRAINNAVASLHRSRVMTKGLSFLKKYTFINKNVHHVLMKLTPSPTGKPALAHSTDD